MNQDAAGARPMMEFHVSRAAREQYQFDEALFSTRGNVIFANFHAARVFAQQMNDKRDVVNYPERAVSAGQINAMGLIDEMLHLLVERYRQQVNPQVMRQALQSLNQQLGAAAVDTTLRQFADSFPPLVMYRREQDVESYMQGTTDGVPNREILLEELLMLYMANANPAFAPFMELFDDEPLEKQTAYSRTISELQAFFEGQPGFGQAAANSRIGAQNLFALLRAPALASPHSLAGQVEFLLEQLGGVLGSFVYRLLSSLDLIKEEEKMAFTGLAGPGAADFDIPNFAAIEHEAENFTPDREWMPRLVLIAKNAFVWLDQLSKQYQRPINTLADIPDEELDRLQRYGITGLWLIGLWERSAASKRIKQIMGNPDAVASAYSLYDYVIAYDLGGDAAVDNLRQRAWQRGIRLASDMVPNHVGIDGKWVMEHPDWFISLPYSPFPSYSFSGPDLSHDERVGVFLEDHYYNRSDAAVVFKRVDRWTGSESYIYHGNDGTSLPWNDTAQLNYLNAAVREAVIQTILHVARQFPVIRFDAAMTLAKKHIQRLWFPEPGSGGAIASRAEHALTKAQFDALMPQEFWREVVDRCAVEAPDTLLLAEAFWMMEGYFVRTLGMHRVYNSAFMNILRDEDNAKYRQIMKTTLEFEPEILKRFVNFMNNPDERTAVEQFGKGDKYFGICTLMVTLPGLPMIGHGQIEGFTEKYGMEYRRAYFDEQPDQYLIERHEREIFPLLLRRYLFADVENFLLYDLFTSDGHVNEDVYAYSNRAGDERALVIYHNRYASARGWIRTSAASAMREGNGERVVRQRSLGEGLGLRHDDRFYTIFRDQASGLEYIRSSRELCEKGLYVELGAYNTHVFLDFREVQDSAGQQWSMLASYLNGRGVPSMDQAMREILLQPIHQPFKELVNADLARRLMAARTDDPTAEPDEALLDELDTKIGRLLAGIQAITGTTTDTSGIAAEMQREIVAVLRLPSRTSPTATTNGRTAREAATAQIVRPIALYPDLDSDPAAWGMLLAWIVTHTLGATTSTTDLPEQSRSLLDEWLLGKLIANMQRELGADEGAADRRVALLRVLVSHQDWFVPAAGDALQPYQVLERWLKDNEVQRFLQVNRYRSILWFNKESYDRLLQWMLLIATLTFDADPEMPTRPDMAAQAIDTIERLQAAGEASEYKLETLLNATRSGAAPTTTVEA